MKKNNYYLKLSKLTSCFLLLITLSLFSCQKKESLSNSEQNTVAFKVKELNTINSAHIHNKATIDNKITNNAKTEYLENFNMILSATSSSNYSSIESPTYYINDTQISKANLTKNTAATQMPIGNKYMLFIYSVSNNVETFVSRHEVTVGNSDFELRLPVGITYNWYAFSYNQAVSFNLSGINNNDPEIPSKTDAPLLIDNGTFTLVANSNTVEEDILFAHQTYKVELQVDVMQFFATNQTISAAFSNQTLTTNNYNLKTKSISGGTSSITYSNPIVFTNGSINNTSTPTIKNSSNEIYTSESNPIITANITSLSVTKNGSTVSVITSSTPISITDFFNNSDKIKRGVVNIQEKSVDTPPLTWGQGNLYYDTSDPLNPYKFGPARTGGLDAADECKYYFNWNTLLPRSLNNPVTLNNTGDPCKEVLPKNTWRTPTVGDFEYISSFSDDLVSVSESTLYLPLPGNVRLYFWDNGTATSNSNPCDIGNTDDGQYWSSNSESEDRGIILYMDGGPIPWIKVASSPGGSNYYNRDKDQGRPVRCVKNI